MCGDIDGDHNAANRASNEDRDGRLGGNNGTN